MVKNKLGFECKLLSYTENPQQVIYKALHQDHCQEYVGGVETYNFSDDELEAISIKNLLKGNRGHWGVFEHVNFVFSFGFIPHSVVAHLTRHRLFSFDVQSFRYTSFNSSSIEDCVYLRPVGIYNNYFYSEDERNQDLEIIKTQFKLYHQKLDTGMSKEQARGILPYDLRQHFVMSGNLRAFWHLLDIRLKTNSQYETTETVKLIIEPLRGIIPQTMKWYLDNRGERGLLAP